MWGYQHFNTTTTTTILHLSHTEARERRPPGGVRRSRASFTAFRSWVDVLALGPDIEIKVTGEVFFDDFKG